VNPPKLSYDGRVDAASAFEPEFTNENSHYDPNQYSMGFFAAIAITTSNVTLYLNGFTIEQSAKHALLQRFFAVIELASSPFIHGAGPAQFTSQSNDFSSASNIKILGPGTIGRSSHHGIHGNENDQVMINGVTFIDFEVAAVSINNANVLTIKNCDIVRNRQDVPGKKNKITTMTHHTRVVLLGTTSTCCSRHHGYLLVMKSYTY
jgi:hypothetical protein